jgi:ABC-2 type transport system ATP-binding protein
MVRIQMDIIEVKNLSKKFGHFTAVDGVSFEVGQGEIFGLLGPNGAGKTTTVRCLLTLIKPTSGEATISGIDVGRHPGQVRQLCGYVPQDVSVDGDLTGYENLLLYAKLYYVPASERKGLIKAALEFMQLTDWAGSMVKNYSGGMMRRLEIGQVLVNRPQILFLDEPSIGLDPSAKRDIWDYVTRLRNDFDTTILLTTHDMLEADELCDRVAIMNRGRIVVNGSPEELKAGLGGDVVSLSTSGADSGPILRQLGYQLLSQSGDGDYDAIVLNGEKEIPRIMEELRQHGIVTESVSLKRATLDDVFVHYAGKRIEESEADWRSARKTRRTVRRRRK